MEEPSTDASDELLRASDDEEEEEGDGTDDDAEERVGGRGGLGSLMGLSCSSKRQLNAREYRGCRLNCA